MRTRNNSSTRRYARFTTDSAIGEEKAGDLAGVRVHKFRMVNQLACSRMLVDAREPVLTLLALGTHENLYRDLKKR